MHHLRFARAFSRGELSALDQQIRIKALSQIAGKRSDFRSLMAATKHFLSQGIRLHEDWVSLSGVGIATALQRKALGMKLPEQEGMSLLGSIVGGESLASHKRGQIGSAADAVASDVLGGASSNHFKAIMLRHLSQRAKTIFVKRQRRRHIDDPVTRIAPGMDEDESGSGMVPADVMIGADPNVLSTDPMVRGWVEDSIDSWRPRMDYWKDIASAWVDDPGARGLQVDLAQQYGVSATTVNNAVKGFVKYLASELERDKRMKKHWTSLLLRSEIQQDIQRAMRVASSDELRVRHAARVAEFVEHLTRCAFGKFEPYAAQADRIAAVWCQSVEHTHLKRQLQSAERLVNQGRMAEADALIQSSAVTKQVLRANMPEATIAKLRDWSKTAQSPFADADALYLEGELEDRGFAYKTSVSFGGTRGDGTRIEVPTYRVYNPKTRANAFEIHLLRGDGTKQLDLYPMKGSRLSPRAVSFRGPMDSKFQALLDQMAEYHGTA